MSLNVPSPGDISYGNTPPGSKYGPFTEKSEMFQRFLTLANQHPSLVSIQVIGECYPAPGQAVWDAVIFKIGNPSGGRVLWDQFIHGNEDFGVETMYAIFKWLLTSGHPRAQRILANNYVCFFPFVNWRWSRMNHNYDDNPCTGSDVNGDKGDLGVNIARDFRNGHQESCPDNYAPPGPYTQPETQAMLAAWDLWNDHPSGWFYVNLHHGSTSRSGGGSRAVEVEILRASVYNELFGGSPTWDIRTSGTSHAPEDAIDYYGASAAFLIEMGASDWSHDPEDYTSLTIGTTYKEMLALFVAQCELVETTDGNGSLNISIGEGEGTTEPTVGIHTYPIGSNVNLTATPSAGYEFSRWVIDGETIFTPTYTLTVTTNHTAVAMFAQIGTTHELTVSPIYPIPAAGTSDPPPGTYAYPSGSTITLKATASAEFIFSRWIINGESYWGTPTIDLIMDMDYTAEARFFRPTLRTSMTPGGTITLNPEGTEYNPGEYTYDKGTIVTVTAIPDVGYKFDNWLIDGGTADPSNPINIVMDSDRTLHAVFSPIIPSHTVVIDSVPQGITFIHPQGVTPFEVEVADGEELLIEAPNTIDVT